MSRRTRRWLLWLTALAAGCNPTVTKDELVTTSAATLAIFAPNGADPCKSVLPFPNDLAMKDGRLNVPFCQGVDTPEQTQMKTGLRTLDGFAVGSTLYTRFSRAIDPATAAAAVRVFNSRTGAPVAVATQFDTVQNNTLFIQPLAPLAEGTKYLVAITTDLKDTEGKAIAPDQVFVFTKSEEPLVDEYGYSRFPAVLDDASANAVEALRQGFAPLFAGLASLGVARESVAVAWAFTTQTVHATLPALAGVTKAGGAQIAWENKIPADKHALIASAGIPADKLCEVHSGRLTLTSLLTASGTFGVDPATGLPQMRPETADYLFITPNTNLPAATTASRAGAPAVTAAISCSLKAGAKVKVEVTDAGARGAAKFRYSLDDGTTWAASAQLVPADGKFAATTGLTLTFAAGDYAKNDLYTQAFPAAQLKVDRVAVFAHGLGRCKNDALALANTFAGAGFAVLTVDGPYAGARTLTSLGDQDLDGCPDQPATPEFIALPGQSPNPFAVRDHLREWALELSQIAGLAKESPFKLAGASTGAAAAKVAVVGHSWGGMAAALGNGLYSGVDALIVNAASAELGAVFTGAIRASVAAQLAAAGVDVTVEPGLTLLATKTNESVAAFRWAMEAGDPLYGGAPTLPTLVQIVAAGTGLAEANLHGSDTQKKLAAALGLSADALARSTFELVGPAGPVCDDGTAVVGALLKPCVEDKAACDVDADCSTVPGGPAPKCTGHTCNVVSLRYQLAMAKTGGLQRQAVTFAASAAAGQPLVCDPDYTKPCP